MGWSFQTLKWNIYFHGVWKKWMQNLYHDENEQMQKTWVQEKNKKYAPLVSYKGQTLWKDIPKILTLTWVATKFNY